MLLKYIVLSYWFLILKNFCIFSLHSEFMEFVISLCIEFLLHMVINCVCFFLVFIIFIGLQTVIQFANFLSTFLNKF